MKIIVNGSLIDVDYIYEITEIENDWNLKFHILFLNDNVKTVEIGISKIRKEYDSIDTKNYSFEDAVEMRKKLVILREEKRKELFNELSEVRNGIIKIWAENQTKFPTFNI